MNIKKEKKMKTWAKIFWIFVLIILIIYIFIGITLNIMSKNICKRECGKDVLAIQIIESGNMKIDDLCICFFPQKIIFFKQDKLNDIWQIQNP